jgi:hypothetical protein
MLLARESDKVRMVDCPAKEFHWRAHPAKERPAQAFIGLTLILAVAMAMLVAFRQGALAISAGQSVALALVSTAVLLLTQNRFFLPSTFTLDATGITARFPLRTQHMRWADLRRFAHDRHGGFLSTRAARSRLNVRGGMTVFFGRQREQVIAQIRSHMNENPSGERAELQAESCNEGGAGSGSGGGGGGRSAAWAG